MLDYVVYWIFGIVFCVFTCRYCKVWRSMRALDPYRNGPWNILRLPDIYVAMLGQIGRQGFFEFAWVFNNMCLKGNATCNCIYVYICSISQYKIYTTCMIHDDMMFYT